MAYNDSEASRMTLDHLAEQTRGLAEQFEIACQAYEMMPEWFKQLPHRSIEEIRAESERQARVEAFYLNTNAIGILKHIV